MLDIVKKISNLLLLNVILAAAWMALLWPKIQIIFPMWCCADQRLVKCYGPYFPSRYSTVGIGWRRETERTCVELMSLTVPRILWRSLEYDQRCGNWLLAGLVGRQCEFRDVDGNDHSREHRYHFYVALMHCASTIRVGARKEDACDWRIQWIP